MKKINLVRLIITGLILLNYCPVAMPGEADVVAANSEPVGGDFYRISVSIKHTDEGWDHYADRWDIYTIDGRYIASRVLRHPHVHKQPFTRSLTTIIPGGVDKILIRAHDSAHEFGGKELIIKVTRNKEDESD